MHTCIFFIDRSSNVINLVQSEAVRQLIICTPEQSTKIGVGLWIVFGEFGRKSRLWLLLRAPDVRHNSRLTHQSNVDRVLPTASDIIGLVAQYAAAAAVTRTRQNAERGGSADQRCVHVIFCRCFLSFFLCPP